MSSARELMRIEAGMFFGAIGKTCAEGEPIVAREITYDSNLHIPLHRHQTARICVMLQGALTECASGHSAQLREGATVFYSPVAAEHADFYGSGTNLTLQLEFSSLEFESLRRYFPTTLESIGVEFFGPIIRRIRKELDRSDANTGLMLRSAAYEMVALASRLRSARGVPSFGIHVAKRFIEDNIDQSLRIGDVAEKAGIRPHSLSETFKRELGMSFRTYVMHLRLERAAQALTESDEAISEIAGKFGFYDQAQLSRLFKRHTGRSPREFRRSSRDL